MKYETESTWAGTVQDVTEHTGPRKLPVVSVTAAVDDLIACLADSDYSHLVYVLDDQRILVGVVAMDVLVKHLFIHFHDDQLDTRVLISHTLCDCAGDLMRNDRLHTTTDASLESLLEKMIATATDEVPVLDEAGCLIADITMKDIIRFYAAQSRERS